MGTGKEAAELLRPFLACELEGSLQLPQDVGALPARERSQCSRNMRDSSHEPPHRGSLGSTLMASRALLPRLGSTWKRVSRSVEATCSQVFFFDANAGFITMYDGGFQELLMNGCLYGQKVCIGCGQHTTEGAGTDGWPKMRRRTDSISLAPMARTWMIWVPWVYTTTDQEQSPVLLDRVLLFFLRYWTRAEQLP